MSEETETPKPAPRSAAASSAPPVWVDLRDPAPFAFVSGNGVSVLTPGLNVVDASAWSSASGHKGVTDAVAAGRIAVVNVDSVSADDMPGMIARTVGRQAIEVLLSAELNKPVTAGPTKRRNPFMVDALKRKLAKLPRAKKAS